MSLRPTCQCLYEIENKLPRTKHCFVACAAQRRRITLPVETCDICGTNYDLKESDDCPVCSKKLQDNEDQTKGIDN